VSGMCCAGVCGVRNPMILSLTFDKSDGGCVAIAQPRMDCVAVYFLAQPAARRLCGNVQ
jgi:hypothetical protein